jgi:hypothetical protein
VIFFSAWTVRWWGGAVIGLEIGSGAGGWWMADWISGALSWMIGEDISRLLCETDVLGFRLEEASVAWWKK